MNQPKLIFKNTFAQTAANLMDRLGNLIIVFILARMLHAEGVGVYSTALAYFSLMDEATNMGASIYLIREIARQPASTSRYVVNFCFVGTIFALISLAVFWTILPHLGYSADLLLSLQIIALAIIPGTYNAVQRSVFVAHQRVEFITYSTIISSLLTLIGTVYLLWSGHGVVSLVGLFVFVQSLAALLKHIFINRYITKLTFQFEPRFALNMLWDIRSFAMLSILGALTAQPEIIILSLVASESQIGFYSAAIKVAYFWLFISQIFMNNVYPVLSRSYDRENLQFQIIHDKAIKYLLGISLPIAVGMAVIAKPVIQLLYGPGFEQSVFLLQVLMIGLPAAFIFEVLWRAMLARNQQDTLLGINIVSLFARLGGGWLLVSFFAVTGAAISVTGNLFLSIMLLVFFLYRDGVHMQFSQLGWRFAYAAAGMGIAAWFLGATLSIWVLIPLAAIVYLALVLVLRGFGEDDIEIFRLVWKPKFAEKN